jgi:ribosomal protein S18 acetylase RimI-like enzyme
VTFTLRGADCLELLEPLWLHLFDHHRSVGDAGFPSIDRSESWPRRRRLYEQLFSEPGTFVVLAERDGTPIGYALCHLRVGPDDTWTTGDVIGEVETLVLSPAARGRGLGTALLDTAEEELARRGAHDVLIAVMAGNESVEEFYRRRGMKPTVTYLMRLGRRPDSR